MNKNVIKFKKDPYIISEIGINHNGYLSLAKKQYENKLSNKFSSWNFGPNKKNFKTVMEIVQFIKNSYMLS